MCTAALQDNLPDFMTNLDGTSITVPDQGPKPIRSAVDVQPVSERSILRRREQIRQSQENPGSHIPSGVRTRKDIMDELT